MRNLILLAVVGLAAQLVDGPLGMAYGVTSSSLLLTVGIAPAAVSAAVHLSEVGTALVSGAAHWRFGNVDWRIVSVMAVPGAVFAFPGSVGTSRPRSWCRSRRSPERWTPSGGWGPVGTTALLSSGRVEARKVVGSIDTSEFAVSVGASLGFLIALGSAGIDYGWVLALLALVWLALVAGAVTVERAARRAEAPERDRSGA